jgi:DNA polymerase V
MGVIFIRIFWFFWGCFFANWTENFDYCTIIKRGDRMGKGGIREGAGRPVGSGRFGEQTKAIRVPVSCLDEVYRCIDGEALVTKFPLYDSSVAAGFPSPTDDSIDRKLDLNELLIRHPAATFFVRVSGQSMIGAGIHHNDVLVVDRSVEAVSGKVVVAAVNGELTVKRLSREGNVTRLEAENQAYAPIVLEEGMDVRVWGVVTAVIHMV